MLCGCSSCLVAQNWPQGTCRKQQIPQLWMKERGDWVWIVLFSQERIVLWSYPRVHCSNNFVSDCSSNTSVWDILHCLESKMSFLSLLPWVDMSKKQRVGYYEQNNVRDKWVLTNSLLPSRPQPLFQSEAKCKAIDMKMFFYSPVHKTHFQKKTGIYTFSELV